MNKELRNAFNQAFTKEKYNSFVKEVMDSHPGTLDFRVAETPVFVPKELKQKILDACESIIDIITATDFKQLTQKAIPKNLFVPNENNHSHFMALDFGICINEQGEIEPQLIEMQGFPSLNAYQVLFPEISKKHFPVPENYSPFLSDHTRESYIQLLKEIILGNLQPEHVILLEIFPST